MLRAAKHICLHNGAEEREDVKIFFFFRKREKMRWMKRQWNLTGWKLKRMGKT